MTQDELDDILSQTLADGKLSRGEKRALREVLSDLKPGTEQSAFIRR